MYGESLRFSGFALPRARVQGTRNAGVGITGSRSIIRMQGLREAGLGFKAYGRGLKGSTV